MSSKIFYPSHVSDSDFITIIDEAMWKTSILHNRKRIAIGSRVDYAILEDYAAFFTVPGFQLA